jgi:leucyl-tRNA synthetase
MESSWYFFRYLSPRDESRMVDREAIDRWFPVNHYIGGVEHAVLHLLYARFYTKVLRDLGIVGVSEPFRHLLTQGMVIKDGAKMSKSKGNVVDPDEMVARYGADTTRLFVLFAAPPEKDLDWQESGVEGMSRFLARVERVAAASRDAQAKATTAGEAGAPWAALERALNRTIVRMTADLGERLQLNTAIAALMEFSNQWIQTVSECPVVTTGDAAVASRVRNVFARLLAPFAPHLAETLWADCGGQGFVAQAEWPQADTANMHESTVEIAVQVNGKLRGRIHVERTMEETGVLEAARSEPNVRRFLEGSVIVKEVIVPGKLVNFVVRPHG